METKETLDKIIQLYLSDDERNQLLATHLVVDVLGYKNEWEFVVQHLGYEPIRPVFPLVTINKATEFFFKYEDLKGKWIWYQLDLNDYEHRIFALIYRAIFKIPSEMDLTLKVMKSMGEVWIELHLD